MRRIYNLEAVEFRAATTNPHHFICFYSFKCLICLQLHNILLSLSTLTCLFISLSSSPSFLPLVSILINMLYDCQVREAGSLCGFTSCSVMVALPGRHGACITKQVRLSLRRYPVLTYPAVCKYHKGRTTHAIHPGLTYKHIHIKTSEYVITRQSLST